MSTFTLIDSVDTAPIMTVNKNNSITFLAAGDELLRMGEDGFYVRGVKVEVDNDEPVKVYTAFKEWLVWQQLAS
jgi:hypothetical protein